ncbi:MAG TPA: CotH kinase family protein [Chitinophagaceae bacterium]|nr:CotH kinase family protein [Chitinophagaceae bacterium]
MRKIELLVACYLLVSNLAAQIPASSNLPIIFINTNGQTIPDDPKITVDMGIIYNGNSVRNNGTDPFNHYNGKIGIEVRGQSSQMFPMKSYSIELRDNAGNSVDKSLFGLPKESDWVLYAPYTDKTLMRNFLAYTMSREMGHWSANCRYAEVVINGDYKGIYVFMEKIKRGSGRVNIAKIATTDISGDAVTGGYIFSLDKQATGWFSSYSAPNATNPNKKLQFDYVYPKVENIVQQQKDYIKSYVDSFENVLVGPQYQDKTNGVRKFADLSSFVDYFIVNEASRNIDGYRLSSFFYKDRNSKNSKIFAGPVWDYDLAFRNADYCHGSDITGWAYEFNYICPTDGAGLVPFWWNKFMADTSFQSDLRCRWKQVRQTSMSLTHLNFLIDSIVNLTAEARARHFQRWPILGQYIWPNPQPIPATYDGEITSLKSWIDARIQWIDANITNTGACYDYPADRKESIIVSINPNPLQGNGTVIIQSKNDQLLYMQVCDMMGRVMLSKQLLLRRGANTMNLNSSYWASGVYFISLQSSNGDKEVRKLLR